MHYLFLSNSIGGLKSFRYEFIETLLKRGDEVSICSPCEISPSIFENMGCKIYPIEMSRHGKNPFEEFLLMSKLKRLFQSIKPDVIFAYTIKPNIYGSIIGNILRIPVIASVTGLGEAVEKRGLMQKFSIFLMKHSMKFASHVFFQNKESMDFFENNDIKLKSKSLIAGSGVNLEKFYQAPYPDENNGIHFLYTGRILEQKGVGLYLKAARKIKTLYPNTFFHIVGIKDDIKFSDLVDEYNADGTIIFHGYQLDPRKYIEISHCQVHPTYYPEGMSNVLLESAAMGRPAIATDKSGCKEIVDDNITGFIIRQNDQQSLEDAIIRFINLPFEEKERLGKNARKKVAKDFDRKKVIAEYINAANKCIV